jgi:hypothetical protein
LNSAPKGDGERDVKRWDDSNQSILSPSVLASFEHEKRNHHNEADSQLWLLLAARPLYKTSSRQQQSPETHVRIKCLRFL